MIRETYARWLGNLRWWCLRWLNRALDLVEIQPKLPSYRIYNCEGYLSPEDEFLRVAWLCARGNVTINLNGHLIRGWQLCLNNNVTLNEGRVEMHRPVFSAGRQLRNVTISHMNLVLKPIPLGIIPFLDEKKD